MMRKQNEILVEVDPLDLEGKPTEERIHMAIAAIERNGLRDNGNPIYPFRQAAHDFNVSKTTLTARFKGRKTKKEAHEKERKLTTAHEQVLVEWIKEKGRRNIPLSYTAVAKHASIISGTEISESWVQRFRARHPELKARWASGLEKCRAQALNEATTTHYFEELDRLTKEYNIKPQHKYSVDEKGAQMGKGERVRVLVDRDQKDVQTVEDGDRELVTIIECVCADGTAIRPGVVFKGMRRDLAWGRDNDCDAR